MHTYQLELPPPTQYHRAYQGPGATEQEKKGQLRLIPNSAVAVVEGGREAGGLPGLEEAALMAPLRLQKRQLGACWSAPLLLGQFLQTNKRLHPTLACLNKCLFIATHVHIQGCHALSFM